MWIDDEGRPEVWLSVTVDLSIMREGLALSKCFNASHGFYSLALKWPAIRKAISRACFSLSRGSQKLV